MHARQLIFLNTPTLYGFSDRSWFHYKTHKKVYTSHNYKLHISVDPNQFDLVKSKIRDLLIKAIEDNLIRSFKIYNVARYLNKPNKDTSTSRQLNHPFVIYLKDDLDLDYLHNIAKLCFEIEHLLKHYTEGNVQTRAVCDLSLTPHIMFRQASLSGTYIPADHPNAQTLRKLKFGGRSSIHYQTLKHATSLNGAFENHPEREKIFAKTKQFLNMLSVYILGLKKEKARLEEEYGEHDVSGKIDILEHKINDMLQHFRSLEKIHDYINADRLYNRYFTPFVYETVMNLFKKIESSIQFSPFHQKMLFAHTEPETTIKGKMFRLFGIPSTSKQHIPALVSHTEVTIHAIKLI